MPDIFLSYNREDQQKARFFAEAMMADGMDVWWDVALKAGEEYDRVTEAALMEARAVVVLWSPRSVESRWVRAEATLAQRNGTLVPVTIEPCSRPIMFELIQTPDLSNWHGDRHDPAWRSFVAEVRSHAGRKIAGPAPVPQALAAVAEALSERRQVTVLSCGLVEPSEAGFDHDFDPEEWQESIVAFQSEVARIVAHFEGKLVPGAGGGITAIFGGDRTREDDAVRGVRAGLGALAAAASMRASGGISAAARIGIDCGPVITGGQAKAAYGPVFDMAARLQLQADPDSVVISAGLAKLAGGYFAIESYGSRAFRVTGESATQTRFDLARTRGLSTFVGRAKEFAILDEALARSGDGHGQVVGLMAEAGTGKSRLCFEFVDHCRSLGFQVIEGSATAIGRNVPFLAVIEVLRSFFGIRSRDDPARARDKIETRVLDLDPRLTDALPALFDFLSVADPARPMAALDPDARQRQLIALVRHLIKIASDAQPTVMMIEDLHWIDDASAQFLEQFVDMREGVRNLLLLNYRPEFRAAWMQNSWCRQISLVPLEQGAIEQMLDDLLGTDDSVAVLGGPINALTKGNPYFVEEIIQTLIETGRIAGTRGDYRMAGAFVGLEIPTTVKAVVAARIDRLPDREKQLLQTASVIGKLFSEPLLRAVSKLSAPELGEALALLRRNEFIIEAAVFPVAEHEFKHPMTLEVALSSLVKERKRHLHAAVARGIEAQEADRLDERAALLAHHWEQAGETRIAADWHKRAAERAMTTDFPTSAFHWEQVRKLARKHPDDPEAIGIAIAACTQLLNMNFRVGIDLAEAEAVLLEGQALAGKLGLGSAQLMLSIVFSRILCGAGDVAGYLALATKNMDAAASAGETGLQVVAHVLLLDALSHSANFPAAMRLADEGLAKYPHELPRAHWATGFNPHTFFAFMRGTCLVWMGRQAEGAEQLQQALVLAEADGTPEIAGWILFLKAISGCFAGDHEQALAHTLALDAISGRLGSPLLVAYSHLAHAWTDLIGDSPRSAQVSARAALDILGKVERHWAGAAAMLLATAHLESGDLEAAVATASEAVTLCERSDIRQFEAAAHGALARALLRRDGAAGGDAATAALARAAAALDASSADALRPALLEWQAELALVKGDSIASAQGLKAAALAHEAAGAPLQAARIRRLAGRPDAGVA